MVAPGAGGGFCVGRYTPASTRYPTGPWETPSDLNSRFPRIPALDANRPGVLPPVHLFHCIDVQQYHGAVVLALFT